MRLIDADKFRKRIDHYPPDIRDIAKKELRYVKTIDAEPIRHGHWEFIGGYGYQYRCSNCGRCAEHRTNYCPSCGAKLDLNEVENE